MHLSLQRTDFQNHFLSHVNDDSRSFFKNKFDMFNVSAELNHSVTTTIFNLINKEIATLKDLIPSLLQSLDQFGLETKNQLKLLISPSHRSFKDSVIDSQHFIFDPSFDFSLKKHRSKSDFLSNKFSASMLRLYSFMGVYEELYLINTLFLSYGPTHTLTFKDHVFTFSTHANSVTFTIFPIFFFVKFLFPALSDKYAIRLILEKFLSFDRFNPSYLVSIADLEQISAFYSVCNMDYLSQFRITKLSSQENFATPSLPTILTISQIHV